MNFRILLLILLIWVQPIWAEDLNQTLKVGVAGSAPFVIKASNPQEYSGISYHLWQKVAEKANIKYEISTTTNIEQGLNLLQQGQIDILVGPVSITSQRSQFVEFTQPYYDASIGVLINYKNDDFWERVKPILSWLLTGSIGMIVLLLFVTGNLIWFVEKKHNSDRFPKSYFQGIGAGIWFAIVTLTTVGYGDKTPVTALGRIVAGFWMILSIFLLSSLTAGLTTGLTLSQINPSYIKEESDLKGKQVAVVDGTVSVAIARNYGCRLILVSSLQEAVQAIIDEKVDVVIHDKAALEYFLRQNPELPVTMERFEFARHHYGFALPIDSDYTHSIDKALLSILEQEHDKFLR